MFVFTADDPDVFLIGNEPVLLNGEILGQLTSVAYGHTIGRSVALGYMRLHGNTAAAMAAETVPVSVRICSICGPKALK